MGDEWVTAGSREAIPSSCIGSAAAGLVSLGAALRIWGFAGRS
jgi:hypothetical protein